MHWRVSHLPPHRGMYQPQPLERPRGGATGGFSLSEVLLAMAVFAIGLAGVGGMQITSIRLNDKAHDTTQLAMVVEEQMEHLITLPLTDSRLQDPLPALGQSPTYCVLYPAEGLRPCQDPNFISAHRAEGTRQYCAVTTGATCSDTNFPPPTSGYKVLWTVDIDRFGNADLQAPYMLHTNLTVSQNIQSRTAQTKRYQMSFSRLESPTLVAP